MLVWRRGYPRKPVHDDYDDVNDGYDYGNYDGDDDTDKSQTNTTSLITKRDESVIGAFQKMKTLSYLVDDPIIYSL